MKDWLSLEVPFRCCFLLSEKNKRGKEAKYTIILKQRRNRSKDCLEELLGFIFKNRASCPHWGSWVWLPHLAVAIFWEPCDGRAYATWKCEILWGRFPEDTCSTLSWEGPGWLLYLILIIIKNREFCKFLQCKARILVELRSGMMAF